MWYLAIVMVISIAFSCVVYRFATDELRFGLRHQTQRIFEEYPVFNNDPILRSPGTDLNESAHRILLELVYFNLLVFGGAGFASYFLARRTLKPIEEAHEHQKRFTADVSHELRTPLTSLKMGSEVALLDKQATKEDLREALESNLEDAGKMDMLINSLLRLTKLDNDAVSETFEPLPTVQLVETAIAQVSKIAKLKGITIKNEVKKFTVIGDREALVQLLVILIDNAIKYSPAKSSVVITASHFKSNVRLHIKDEGRGISPSELPHVFDRFYRADASRNKTDGEGFGLGLSIAKLIADRHHGDITLTSRLDKGTTAVISLPQADTNRKV